MSRNATAAAIVALAVAAAATAAAASWSTQAAMICRAYRARAVRVLGTTPPRTDLAKYRFAQKAVPLEQHELTALEDLPGTRPAAASRALAAAHVDLSELESAVTAWSSGRAVFGRAFARWFDDRRADRAFIAAGIPACAG